MARKKTTSSEEVKPVVKKTVYELKESGKGLRISGQFGSFILDENTSQAKLKACFEAGIKKHIIKKEA